MDKKLIAVAGGGIIVLLLATVYLNGGGNGGGGGSNGYGGYGEYYSDFGTPLSQQPQQPLIGYFADPQTPTSSTKKGELTVYDTGVANDIRPSLALGTDYSKFYYPNGQPTVQTAPAPAQETTQKKSLTETAKQGTDFVKSAAQYHPAVVSYNMIKSAVKK